jgi:predicted metal-dependent phosphoesterase TrpH
MAKGLDSKFINYGIRENDLNTIATLCETHQLDREWVMEEILRKYHEAKVDAIEMSDTDTERIINAAIALIKSE